jgi:predicted site-specific integrase-resolvase
MPLLIDGKRVYRIGEALATASLSRATYFRWIKQGRIRDTHYKDRNGRRVFTEEELDELRRETDRLIEAPQIPLTFG